MLENKILDQSKTNNIEVTLINTMKMKEVIKAGAEEEEIGEIIIIAEEEGEVMMKFQIDLTKNTTKNILISRIKYKQNNHRFNKLKFK